jgi:salicylate hydroxylase
MKALAAGGGIGGLAAALALARTGWTVTLFEQAAELAEAGAAVQLSPNAVKALRWLGVEADLAPRAAAPEAIEVRRWRDDKLLSRSPLGATIAARHGAPYWHVLRSDLQAVLLTAASAAGVESRLGARVTGVETTDTTATLVGESGPLATGDLLLAADGVRSTLRSILVRGAPARFTGQVAWRGLVPAGGLDHPPSVIVRVGPGRHFVSYRVRGGEAVNFVGVVEEDGWRAEGWSEPGERRDLAEAFAGWPAPVQAIIHACEQPFRWALLDRDPAPPWTRGRAVLLGDAAHPVLPFLAQGAALALEDAVVLARRLSDAGDVRAGLARYEAARAPRAARVSRASRRNAFAFHASGPAAWAGQTALSLVGRVAPSALSVSLDRLYGYDPATA